MTKSKLLSSGEAQRKFNVTRHTLLRYEEDGIIKPLRTPRGRGQRRYLEDELADVFGLPKDRTLVESDQLRVATYYRVSTRKQADAGNLQRQVDRLGQHCKDKKYKLVEHFEEIASGVNEKRRQLLKMMKLATTGEIDAVVVEYKDRLARFGFRYLEFFFSSYGVQVLSIEEKASTDENAELVKDLITIVTSFASRVYGRRGGRKTQQQLEQALMVSDGNDTDNDPRDTD